MGASVRPSVAWVLPAEPSAVTLLRRRAAEFVSTAGASDEVTQAVALAVSEAVTNAVVHAYDAEERGHVRVSCNPDGERFIVEVVDEGAGIWLRQDSPGLGHGLAMVGALAHTLNIAPGPDGRGTAVTMTFGPVSGRPPQRPGWSLFADWHSRPSPTSRAWTSSTTACCAALPQRSPTIPC